MVGDFVTDANLSRDSDDRNNDAGGKVGDWVRISVENYTPEPEIEPELELELESKQKGGNFAAQLYRNSNGRYKISYCRARAFSSTVDQEINQANQPPDWTTELSQSVKFTLEAIRQIARKESLTIDDAAKRLSLTGRGQGGFESEVNAALFGLDGTSIDGPGAAYIMETQGWLDIKKWVQEQEPNLPVDVGIGEFTARCFTLVLGGLSRHIEGVQEDNALASVFVRALAKSLAHNSVTDRLFTSVLPASILHPIDGIATLQQWRQEDTLMQLYVDKSDVNGDGRLALDLISAWPAVHIFGSDLQVNSARIQATINGYLIKQVGMRVSVQRDNKNMRLLSTSDDELMIFEDGSALITQQMDTVLMQTEYGRGAMYHAMTVVQVDKELNRLISRSELHREVTYGISAENRLTQSSVMIFNAQYRMVSETTFRLNKDGTYTTKVFDPAYALQSTTITKLLTGGRRMETVTAGGSTTISIYDANNVLAGELHSCAQQGSIRDSPPS